MSSRGRWWMWAVLVIVAADCMERDAIARLHVADAAPSLAPGRVLVGMHPRSARPAFAKALAKAGVRSVETLPRLGVEVAAVAPDARRVGPHDGRGRDHRDPRHRRRCVPSRPRGAIRRRHPRRFPRRRRHGRHRHAVPVHVGDDGTPPPVTRPLRRPLCHPLRCTSAATRAARRPATVRFVPRERRHGDRAHGRGDRRRRRRRARRAKESPPRRSEAGGTNSPALQRHVSKRHLYATFCPSFGGRVGCPGDVGAGAPLRRCPEEGRRVDGRFCFSCQALARYRSPASAFPPTRRARHCR